MVIDCPAGYIGDILAMIMHSFMHARHSFPPPVFGEADSSKETMAKSICTVLFSLLFLSIVSVQDCVGEGWYITEVDMYKGLRY